MIPPETSAAARVTRVAEICYEQGICRTGGNVSVRVGARLVITPSGYSADYLGRVPSDDLCWVDLDGKIGSGSRPSRETSVHVLLYRWDSSFLGIIHAHPPHTLAFSADPAQLSPVTQSARKFRMLHVCRHEAGSNESLSEALEKTLPDQHEEISNDPYGFFVLVPWHGVFVAAKSVERALYFLNKVEENAKILLLQMSLRLSS